jgi:glycosyltransferase involved in cell wall biosynthesis
MKVLFVAHDFNNYGGIINHTEQLMAGFKDLGHSVELVCLKPSKKVSPLKEKTLDNYDTGEGSGIPVHQGNGWYTQYQPFLSSEYIETFVKKANTFDLVIWESIFGFKCKETEGTTEWVKMIQNVTAKQIVIVHDGNLLKFYPWIYNLKSNITGLACVHPSAFNSAEQMEIPRMLIVNPQKDIERVESKRENQILSLQTFKRWKRVDNLVAAVPHMPEVKVIVAGDGIERAYMASTDKCKPEYYCTPESDKYATDDMIGKRIWENAINSGMEYIGFISESTRDTILAKSKFLIDTSWSKTYGSHFNRVIVDAMRVGVVPIARNLGVSDNEQGTTGLLTPNENYLMIPWDATPHEFASCVKKFMSLSDKEYTRIVENNYKLVEQNFNRKVVAAQYIELAEGHTNPAGSLTDKKVKETIDELWTGHFGFKEKVLATSSLESFF